MSNEFVMCASCNVVIGECPVCHTFWIRGTNGKMFGVRPSPRPTYRPGVYMANGTAFPFILEEMANVVTVGAPWHGEEDRS